jgi:anti-sigma factor RsiW
MFDFLRDRTKSSTELNQEALSAYLDNALAPAERQRVEQLLAQDARLRAEVQQLRVLKQQLAQMPSRRVPRNFTLDPAIYGRPQRQPLLKLYPVLQGATALAALIFILVLGLGFFQGQFSGGLPSAVPDATTQVLTETAAEEQPIIEAPAEEAAEEPAAEEALILGEAAAEPTAEAAAVEEPAAEAELLEQGPLTGTFGTEALPTVIPPESVPDTASAETLGSEATVAAEVGAADTARQTDAAPTGGAVAETVANEADSAEDAGQAADLQGINLFTTQVIVGILFLALLILLFLVRRRLSRW